MRPLTFLLSVICIISFALQCEGQSADVVGPGEERLTLALGGFLTGFDADLRIDNSGVGTRFNLKDDLGVERQQTGIWAGAEWRFFRRHRIAVNYTRFTPSATRTVTRSIQIGEVIYPVSGTLSTKLHMEIVPVTYSFSFIKRESDELAATIGVNWNRMNFDVAEPNFDLQTNADANFPLPLAGLRYDHHFSQRWSLGLQAAGFKLRVGEGAFDVKGDLWNARAQVEYRFARHFAAVAAVDAFSLDVDANKSSWLGSINYRFWGPQLYLKARF
jgi:hypothetical protein